MRPLTLACDSRGSLLIYVGTTAVPDDEEWDRYLELARSIGQRGQAVRIAIFVDRDAAAPTALQRKRTAELMRSLRHDAVVISESLVARTAVTALRWLGVEIHAFSPSRQEDALERIGASPEERAWLFESERRLRALLSDGQHSK